MFKFGKFVVKSRVVIVIIALILLVPSFLGFIGTRINYDMLTYLPDDIETVKGQNILLDDFGKGAFSIIIVEGMEPKDISSLKADISEVEDVDTVVWYDSLADITIPMEFLPDDIYDIFNNGDATIMAVFFDTSTSADETMDAISSIRSIAGEKCLVSGMSAMVTDLKELCEREEPIYVALAVVLSCVAMMIFMDSWIIPFIFLASIGMAIMLNLGTNYFFGEISFITKALSAVLQLAVTMDYSIFLWHSYTEEKEKSGDKKDAMSKAIANTITSVVGSSITTVAGFIALCFMSYTLGADLGIVMAKGVVIGVIGCVTTLPSLILLLDRPIEKTRHKALIPKLGKFAKGVTKVFPIFLVLFVIILVPAYYGYEHTDSYYDLSQSLPQDLDFMVANKRLQTDFNMANMHMVLADKDLSPKTAKAMLNEIDDVDGVKFALGMDSLVGSSIPKEILPSAVTDVLEGGDYQLMLISSEYKTASDEVNEQVAKINDILDKYDEKAMLIGEAPCTKDLITITDHDFQVVNIISIAAIFIIIALVLKSITLPFILVAVIEFAIFINLGIPFYTSTELPFIAPICISTIQLGATVDYAILMTTRYKKERFDGADKREAVSTALSASIPSILVSALGFFAATFGVGLYSDIDMISSLCNLMARGAIISMFSVIFVLPAMFMLLDKVIIHTSVGFIDKTKKVERKEAISDEKQ